MDNLKKEKITQFLNDKIMSNAVKEVLDEIVAKPCKDRDVNILAGRFLAIEIISDTWRELNKYKNEKDSEPNQPLKQVGL